MTMKEASMIVCGPWDTVALAACVGTSLFTSCDGYRSDEPPPLACFHCFTRSRRTTSKSVIIISNHWIAATSIPIRLTENVLRSENILEAKKKKNENENGWIIEFKWKAVQLLHFVCILCFPGQKLRNANFRLNVHCYVFIDIESHPLLAAPWTSEIEMHWAWAVCQIDVYSLHSYMRMRQYLRSAEQKFAFGANSCARHPAIQRSVQLILWQYFPNLFEKPLSRNYQFNRIFHCCHWSWYTLFCSRKVEKRNGTNNSFHADSEEPFSAYKSQKVNSHLMGNHCSEWAARRWREGNHFNCWFCL